MGSSTKIFIGFKGVKNSSLHTKAVTKIEEVWDAIFQPKYKQPRCPDCQAILVYESVEIVNNLNAYYSMGKISNVLQGPEDVNINFHCADCGLRIQCKALGMKWDLERLSFTLEEMEPYSMERHIR